MNDNTSRKTAERLKDLRKRKNLSHAQLRNEIKAKYGIDISKSTLLNYEVSDPYNTKYGSNAGMKIEFLSCFADFYEVSADYLLGRTDTPTTDVSLRAASEYTGLSNEVVDCLHINSIIPEYRSFNERFVGDILLIDNGVTVELADLISKSAMAFAMSMIAAQPDSKKIEITNTMNKIQGMNCFTITGQEAADLFLSKAVTLVTAHFGDVIRNMRDDRCAGLIAGDNGKPLDPFDWSFVREEEAHNGDNDEENE